VGVVELLSEQYIIDAPGDDEGTAVAEWIE